MKSLRYEAPSTEVLAVAPGQLLAASQLEDLNYRNPIPFEQGSPIFDGGFAL